MRYFLSLLLSNFIFSLAFAQDIEKLAHAFGMLPEISDAQLSPDGDKIFFLQYYQGETILVSKSLSDSTIPPVGIPYPGGKIDWVKWTSNERVLVGVSFDDRVDISPVGNFIFPVDARLSKLVAMDWNGENSLNPVPIVDRKVQPQFQANIVDFMMSDPDHILVQIDVDELGVVGVQKIAINSRSKRYTKILRGRFIILNYEADGNHVVRYGNGTTGIYGRTKQRYIAYYRFAEDEEWFELYDIDLKQEIRPFEFVAFTEDPEVIYILKSDKNGKHGLYKYNVSTKQVIEKISEDEDYEVEYVELDDFGKPLWYSYHAEIPGIVYLTDFGKRVEAIFKKSFPGKYVEILSETKDPSKVVFKVSASNDPGSFYILDLNNMQIEMIYYIYKEVDCIPSDQVGLIKGIA